MIVLPVTYEPIASTLLTGPQSTITFSSIPATYTDLILVINFINDGAATAADSFIRLNSDTGGNYSTTQILGNGSTVSSARASNQTYWMWAVDQTTISTAILQIMNYSNTTTNKTALLRIGNANQAAVANVFLWRQTSAINSIAITAPDRLGQGTPDSFTTGSVFSLYGIKAA